MTDQPENPTVFPQSFAPDGACGGIGLRDLFAAAALTGMGTWMPPGYIHLDTQSALEMRAKWAYEQADAMLRERGK